MPNMPAHTPPGCWSFVVMGDTQSSARLYPDNLIDAGDWINNNALGENIKVVLHVGDIVDQEPDTSQWDAVEAFYARLDSINLPYTVVAGQHDALSAAGRTYDKFYTYFPTTRFTGKSWWNGAFKSAGKTENSYLLMTIMDRRYIFINLEWGPTAETMTWLDNLLTSYASYQAIIVTHSYLSNDGDRVTTGDFFDPHNAFADCHNGEEMWNEVLSHHDNVIMVWSGDWPVAQPQHMASNTDGGYKVVQVLFDYQSLETTDFIFFSFVTIDPNNKTIRVQIFSPNAFYPIDADFSYSDVLTYDNAEEIPESAGLSGQKIVATAGIEEILGNRPIGGSLMVKALTTNTGLVYVGESSGGVSSSTGMPLDVGEVLIFCYVTRLNNIWVDSSVNGEGVAWLALRA